MFSIFITALFGVAAVQAFPTLFLKQIPLNNHKVCSYNTYTYFAKAAYCGRSLGSWSCGAACQYNHDFQIEAHGGDGHAVPQWYVGYSKYLNSVVVAHEGTNTSHMIALTAGRDANMAKLEPSLFHDIPSGIEVHKVFQDEHARTAKEVLSSVRSAMSKHKCNHVTLVGHSLGAALATLDAVYLHAHLPSTTSFKIVAYGLPRVGNQAFANYVDAHTPITHITNKKDPVPILPPKNLGYAQPSGEIHITDKNAWTFCTGQENDSKSCSDGEVPDALKGVMADNDGPYNGITLGRCHDPLVSPVHRLTLHALRLVHEVHS